MAITNDDLRRVPLFSTLSGRQLRQLKKQFKERTFGPGTAILREGEMSGVGFFVLVDGAASVSVGEKELQRLGPGDHFGELALIVEQERTATVTAVEQSDCLMIASWHFRKFVQDNPDVSWKLLQHVATIAVQKSQSRL